MVIIDIKASSSISIHALRGEGDNYIGKLRAKSSYFNPRPPWGGRPALVLSPICLPVISIHALRGEGDCKRRPRR